MVDVGDALPGFNLNAEEANFVRSRPPNYAIYTPSKCVADFAKKVVEQPCMQQYFKSTRKRTNQITESVSPA